MNQGHREPVKDLAMQRRKYMRERATSCFNVIGGFCLSTGCSVLGLILIVATLQAAHSSVNDSIFSGVLAAGVVGLVVYIGCLTVREVRLLHRIEYVPPVREQIAHLPVEEVLLRGSDQPNATPEELLRAAQAGTIDPKEELLRAEPVQSGEQHSDTGRIQQTQP